MTVDTRPLQIGRDVQQMRPVMSNAGRRSVNGLIQHFGLGDATLVDTLVLTLTEGEATAIGDNGSALNGLESYRLYQNYLNPFNPSTIIKFQIPNFLYDFINTKSSPLPGL